MPNTHTTCEASGDESLGGLRRQGCLIWRRRCSQHTLIGCHTTQPLFLVHPLPTPLCLLVRGQIRLGLLQVSARMASDFYKPFPVQQSQISRKFPGNYIIQAVTRTANLTTTHTFTSHTCRDRTRSVSSYDVKSMLTPLKKSMRHASCEGARPEVGEPPHANDAIGGKLTLATYYWLNARATR